jgi:hypothetical protein
MAMDEDKKNNNDLVKFWLTVQIKKSARTADAFK